MFIFRKNCRLETFLFPIEFLADILRRKPTTLLWENSFFFYIFGESHVHETETRTVPSHFVVGSDTTLFFSCYQ